VLLQVGGTPQQRTERDGAAAAHAGRLGQLEAAEHGLCFGRLDLAGDGLRYVGRIGILDENSDYEPLLVDWRAPAARPFYVATAAAPVGVRRRRHIRTRLRRVVGLDDDALALDSTRPAPREAWSAEAVLLAAVTANRTGRMRDVVETIQVEQDHAIRADLGGVLVVQGKAGPKAPGRRQSRCIVPPYLLYTYRERSCQAGRADSSARTRPFCGTSRMCCPALARPARCCARSASCSRAWRPGASSRPRPARSRGGP